MDEINRCLEWSVRRLRIDIGKVPDDFEQVEIWSQFWRELNPILEAGHQPALVQFVRQQYVFRFDSKSFIGEIRQLFSRWVSVEACIEHLRGQVWLSNVESIASDGLLVVSARVQFDLPLASPKAASRFDEVMNEDWEYIWDKGSLYGPESCAHQDGFACDGYALRMLDQQRPIASFSC